MHKAKNTMRDKIRPAKEFPHWEPSGQSLPGALHEEQAFFLI